MNAIIDLLSSEQLQRLSIDEIAQVDHGTEVYMCVCVVPMGLLNVMSVVQDFHRSLGQNAGLPCDEKNHR